MKIAICFSGQIRTGVESSENIIRFLGQLYPFCDFFIHTWDKNSQKNFSGTKIYPPEEMVAEDTIEKIRTIYKPKKMIVENFDEVKLSNTIGSRSLLTNNVPGLWYSFHKSVEYKKEYEVENNFEYDFVVKLRFDIIFPELRRLEENYRMIGKNIKTMVYIENPPGSDDINEKLPFIDDEFYLGSSKNMDIFGDYYNKMKDDMSDFRVYGYFLLNYLNDNNITFYNGVLIHQMMSAVYRPECLKYSPMTEFMKCLKCGNYYYYAPEPSCDECGQYYLELLKKYEVDDIFNTQTKVFTNELKLR